MVTYNVYVNNAFFMSAPMSTLRVIFALMEPAVARIERETLLGDECTVFFNGRSAVRGVDQMVVRRERLT